MKEFEKTTDVAPRVTLKDKVERLIHEYLIYMWLIKANPEQRVAPSNPIDVVWHHHILFTRECAQFCELHFGKFIHHAPTVIGYSKYNSQDNIRDYSKLLIRYKYHTKLQPPVDIWPQMDTPDCCGYDDDD